MTGAKAGGRRDPADSHRPLRTEPPSAPVPQGEETLLRLRFRSVGNGTLTRKRVSVHYLGAGPAEKDRGETPVCGRVRGSIPAR